MPAIAKIPQSSSEAAKQVAHYERLLHPALWQDGATLPSTPAGTGSSYEISADVVGRVGCDDQDALLLKMNGASLTALIPHDTDASWIDSGQKLRLIVRDNLASSNATSMAGYTVIAAAPEVEVTALQGPLVSSRSSSRLRSASIASRSAVYQAGEYPSSLPPGHPTVQLSERALAVYPLYRSAIQHFNPRLDDLTLDKITTSILAYSTYYNTDPRLIIAMIIAESGFNPNEVSRDGAMGLGQLMPGTAAGMMTDRGTPVNPWDPVQNVGASVKILSTRVNQYGGADANGIIPLNTLLLTMASYNAGAGAVAKFHGVPPYRETQYYVRKVAALYQRLCGN